MTETEDYAEPGVLEYHAYTHENGGDDEISVAALSGELADEQDAGKIKGLAVPAPAAGDDEKALVYDHDTGQFKYVALATISNDPYGDGWDGVETIAGSKNALYDKIETLKRSYVKVSNTVGSGVSGGSFIAGDWRIRILDVKDSDVDGICSLASNQITLAAGTYECRISAPAYMVTYHKAILFNATDFSDVLTGTAEYTTSGTNVVTRSFISGKFTIAAGKALEVRHRAGVTNDTQGFGVACGWGNSEVYTIAEFWKVQ